MLYKDNKKIWVTQQLFEVYNPKLHRKFELQGHELLMLTNNFAACDHVNDLKTKQLEFLSINTTSLLQSVDRENIQTLNQLSITHA